jgi:hypothetical protein
VDAPRGELGLDRTYGDGEEEAFEAVVPVADDEFVAVGTVGAGESRDAHVVQVDAEGDVVYERTLTGPNDDGFGAEGEDALLGAAVGPRGKILAVGYTVYRGDVDAWVVKLGRELRIQREETFDSGAEATVASDVVARGDGFAVAGWTGEADDESDVEGPWLALSDRDGRVENPRTYAVAGEAGRDVELATGREDGFALSVAVTEDDRSAAHLLVVNRSREVVSRAEYPSGVRTHTDVGGLVRTADGYALAGTQYDVRDGDRTPYLVRTNRRGTTRSRQVFPGEGTTLVAELANGTDDGYVLVGRTFDGDGDGSLGEERGDAVGIRTDGGAGAPVVTRYGTTSTSRLADVVADGDRYVAAGSTVVPSNAADRWLVGIPSVARSSFAVFRLDAPGRVATGDRYDVAATVSNGGSVEGTRTVAYRVDTDGDGELEPGETVASDSVTLAGDAERRVTFDADAGRLFAGEYRHGVVVVDGDSGATVAAATLVVTDGDDSDGSGGAGEGGGTGGAADVSLAWNRTYGGTDGTVGAVVPASGDGYTLVGSQAARGYLFRVDAEGRLVERDRFTDADVGVVDATATADGGVVVAGQLLPRADGTARAVVVRVAPDGEVVWNRTFAGATVASGVVRTADGYAVSLADTADAPDYDGALVRVAPDGDERSRRTFSDVAVARVAPVESGGLLLAGFVGGAERLSEANRDPWAARLTPSGSVAFERTYDHGLDTSMLDVVDTDAGPVLVGSASTRNASSLLGVAVALGLDDDGDVRFNATTVGVGGLRSVAAGPAGVVAVGYNATRVYGYDASGDRTTVHRVERLGLRQPFGTVVDPIDGGYVVGGSYPQRGGFHPWAAALTAADGGDGDDGDVAPGDVELSVEPSTVATTPEGTTTVAVVASGLDAGAGGWDLSVRSADPTVARVVDATAGGDPTVDDVQVAGDGSRVDVQAALAAAGADGSATLATVTVEGDAPGRTALELDVEEVVTTDGDRYPVAVGSNATVVVRDASAPRPVDEATGAVPTDPDGDGRFEDVNGDGASGVGDVVALFANLDAAAVQEFPTAYDFNGDGAVGIGDVVVLFDEVLG